MKISNQLLKFSRESLEGVDSKEEWKEEWKEGKQIFGNINGNIVGKIR